MLSLQQYGFRSNHSTELAALNLVDELTYKLDRGIIPMNIYRVHTTLNSQRVITKSYHFL